MSATRGRPSKDRMPKKTVMTYEEMCERHSDADIIEVQYDGICRKGHWYEDHMLKMFSECKMIHLTGNIYQVAEWAGKGA